MLGSIESLRNEFSLVKAVAFEKGVLARKGSRIAARAGADEDSLARPGGCSHRNGPVGVIPEGPCVHPAAGWVDFAPLELDQKVQGSRCKNPLVFASGRLFCEALAVGRNS